MENQLQNKKMNNIRINRLIKEVLDSSNNLVNIDINDVRDLFQEGGEIHTYDVSVSANEKNRMQLLMEQIKKCSKCHVPYHRALVFFYISETQPLLMEELKPLSEWIESIPGEFMIKWGMATLSIPKIRAIVALQ
jgi:cell division GTPase FtsZ